MRVYKLGVRGEPHVPVTSLSTDTIHAVLAAPELYTPGAIENTPWDAMRDQLQIVLEARALGLIA